MPGPDGRQATKDARRSTTSSRAPGDRNASRVSAAGPEDAPRRLFYGWVLVLALGVTETVSYGILTYAFPVFIAPMTRELGWSKTAITGAFSLASLVAGAAAIPVGRWIDRHGARGVMSAGSVLGVAMLAAWSRVESTVALYAVFAGIGVAMAAVLYEPAFAVVASWFDRHRGRALTVLTFMGGFASVVFVPLATWLVAAAGWRGALLWLAAILGLLTLPPHALLLRRRPEDLGLALDGVEPAPAAAARWGAERGVSARAAVRSRGFALLAAAFALSALANTGITVHLIPLLLERGYGAGFAAAGMATLGLMALPGRLVFTPLGGWWPRPAVTAAIFVLQAVGFGVLLAAGGAAGVWIFVALFGAGFGAIPPARAALLAERYGRASYASISGMLALVLALARAAAPVGASVLYTAGGYGLVLWVMLAISVAAAACVLASGRPDDARLDADVRDGDDPALPHPPAPGEACS